VNELRNLFVSVRNATYDFLIVFRCIAVSKILSLIHENLKELRNFERVSFGGNSSCARNE